MHGVEPYRSHVSAALARAGIAVVDAAASAVRVTVLAEPDGHWGLTRREREVMEHVAGGETNREIAAALDLCEKTVRNHVGNIFAKLGATHRAEAVAQWFGIRP